MILYLIINILKEILSSVNPQISNTETNFCSIGLEYQCSKERQKMKCMAIKGIIEAQRMIRKKGKSNTDRRSIDTIAKVSSIPTESAKYIAIHDALVSDLPDLSTMIQLNYVSIRSNEDKCMKYELFNCNRSPKRTRVY